MNFPLLLIFQFIIFKFQFRKFDKSIWGSATEEEKAVANLTRVALEEHFAWYLIIQFKITENVSKNYRQSR